MRDTARKESRLYHNLPCLIKKKSCARDFYFSAELC